MLSFLYVYSDHSILECYNLFSGVELSMRSFFVIYPMPLHFRILRFFNFERIWYFLLKSAFIALFLSTVCVFSTSNKHNFIFIFIHILLTVQHDYPIIIQCSESFSLEKLYFRLNDICGVLQLYDPPKACSIVPVFFL